MAGKVFLHSPHQQSLGDGQISYLNINKQITTLVAGCLNTKDGRDVLLVGTPTSLQCYDINQNKDLFYKDVTDGVNVAVVGMYGSGRILALVGGNCSIQVQGFEGSTRQLAWHGVPWVG